MAEAIKQGAKMLSDLCPYCNVPLFRIDNEVKCVVCNRRIILVKGDEEERRAKTAVVLIELRDILEGKIKQLNMELPGLSLEELKYHLEILELLLKVLSETNKLIERLLPGRGL